MPEDKVLPLDFKHNDYLTLSQHPAIIEAGQKALTQYGSSSKASRLITNQNQALVSLLEHAIASAKHTESALVYCSGFQANLTVIAALLDSAVLGAKPLVFTDKLNHASMHLGCQLAGVKQIRYRHLDYEHLAWQLDKHQSTHHPSFILTESIFGMDGDKVDLAQLIPIAKNAKAFLYLDEAHATGLYGPHGYGLSTDYQGEIDLIMGTFSKALGCFGAYIACSDSIKQYLINRCQGVIYTTLMMPAQMAMMQAAWQLVPSMQTSVKKLMALAENTRKTLAEHHFNFGNSQTNIIPIRLKCPEKVLKLQTHLAEKGIGVAAIRPPSVMPNESRLRIALNTSHTPEQVKLLIDYLAEWLP